MALMGRKPPFFGAKKEDRKIVDNYLIILYTDDILNFQNIMMVYEIGEKQYEI